MKKEFSNKTIVSLLVVALFVTIVGAGVSIFKLSSIEGSFTLLTGAAVSTATGTSNISIQQSTSITNRFNLIEFGTGYVTTGSCVMSTTGQHNQTGANCLGQFRNNTKGFFLENTGNINLSVNYTCSGSCTAATLVGGTSPAFGIRTWPQYVRNQSNESTVNDTISSCNGQGFEHVYTLTTVSGSASNTSLNLTNGYYALTAAGDWLCGNNTNYPLDYGNTQDAFVVDINVSVPTDAPTGSGVKTATITFNALATG